MRLRLKPGLRRVWRDPATLQIGLSRRRGTVLTGLTLHDVALIDALNHGLDNLDDNAVSAFSAPGHPARSHELLQLLAQAGVLAFSSPETPGPARLGPSAARLTPDAAIWSVVHPSSGDGWPLLAARAGRHVVVRGAGRLGSALAATLAAAGVGTVVVRDAGRVTAADLSPAGAGLPDLGRPRQAVGQDLVRRAGGHPEHPASRGAGSWRGSSSHQGGQPDDSVSTLADGRPEPDLVILVEHGTANAGRADPLVSADIPHLVVVVGEDGVVVGPLVLPGSSPCLRCLDLHRQDRDPGWLEVLDQVHEPAQASDPAEETASTALAAGLATLQALAHLDGQIVPAAVGATLEVELPDGLVARRPWPVHPSCGCCWPAGTPEPLGPLPEPFEPGEGRPGARREGREGRMLW